MAFDDLVEQPRIEAATLMVVLMQLNKQRCDDRLLTAITNGRVDEPEILPLPTLSQLSLTVLLPV